MLVAGLLTSPSLFRAGIWLQVQASLLMLSVVTALQLPERPTLQAISSAFPQEVASPTSPALSISLLLAAWSATYAPSLLVRLSILLLLLVFLISGALSTCFPHKFLPNRRAFL